MGLPRSNGPAHAPPTARSAAFRHDLQASLVVFLIAVPLSLGIAAASGAPVIAGLVAAVVGGLVATPLGGSRLQVSGAATGLTVVVAQLVAQFGWAVTCAITVCAGVAQLLLGVCRVGRVALAISPTVVHAILAGIGITIVLGQVHVLLGGVAGSSAWANLRDLPSALLSVRPESALVGLLVVLVLVLWPRLPARLRAVPGPLVAVVLATAATLHLDLARVSLPDAPLAAFSLPELPDGQWLAFAVGVATMTIVASVESLLSAVAVDRLRDHHRADLDRELRGQGTANVVSGLLGGLPIAGGFVRGSANVRAGARTRASAVMHGAWVLLFTLFLVGLVERVPMAALAGLLVVVGSALVRVSDIRTAHTHGELLVYAVTITSVVLLNLLHGVLLGFAVALLATLRRVVWARVRVERGERGCAVVVEGVLCFLSVPRLSRVLAQVPDGSAVHLELVVDYLDHAAYEHLAAWRRQHESTGGSVVVDEIGRVSRPATRRPRWLSAWSDWQGARVAIPEQSRHACAEAFVVTCADSTTLPTVPDLLTRANRYALRNVGNLVPGDLSMRAGVLYALDHLRVPTMVVCGHSRCGAMEALLAGTVNDPIGRWLRWAEPSLRAWRDGHSLGVQAEAEGRPAVDQLALVNVAVQLESLRSMPDVAAAIAAGRVRLVGLFFDARTGTVLRLDESGERYRPHAGAARLG